MIKFSYQANQYFLHLRTKKKSMRKGLLLIVISLVSLILVVALAISPITKSVLENHSKEYFGRKVSMNDLSLNILSGRLKVSDFTIYEADDTTPFVTLNLFDVNVNLKKLLTKTCEIESILFSNLTINVTQNGEKFNFTDILNMLCLNSHHFMACQTVFDLLKSLNFTREKIYSFITVTNIHIRDTLKY